MGMKNTRVLGLSKVIKRNLGPIRPNQPSSQNILGRAGAQGVWACYIMG